MERINLGQTEKEMYPEMAISPKSDRNKVRYPTFTVNKRIPISSKMLNKTIKAKDVDLRVKRVDIRSVNGKVNYSCDFEVLSLSLPSKKEKDYSSTEGMEKILKEI